MKTVALLCLKYEGGLPPLPGPFFSLDESKYRKIVIYLKQGSDAPNPAESRGCKVLYISRLPKFRIFNFAAIGKLVRILRSEKVDILHCQRHQATVYGAIAGRLAKTRVVLAHVHGLNRSKKVRRKVINRLVLRWVNRIVAVSESTRRDVLECNRFLRPEQVICLGNSIDCERFSRVAVSRDEARERLGLRPGTLAFVAVGRLVPTKGLTDLIRAFAAVKKEIADSELVLVGDGRQREELEGLARSLGLEGAVHFAGFREDVEVVLRGMDVFVMASIAEGMPGALLEAMASGLPCIATRVGGIPDVLEEGGLGVLVPAGDAEGLAAAMLKVARGIEDYAKMAAEGRKRVLREYDHGVTTKKLESIYETGYRAEASHSGAV